MCQTSRADEIVVYGFERGKDDWAIPDWAKANPDYTARNILVSDAFAGEGTQALEVNAAFPGGRWTGVYVEHEMEVTDWSPFGVVSLDVLLPAQAPSGLTSRIILTTGDQWSWNEMSRSTHLIPGEWTTVSANLKPGSMDWKFFPDDGFRSDVRKLGIRVESDHGPVYEGPIYIDNIRMGE